MGGGQNPSKLFLGCFHHPMKCFGWSSHPFKKMVSFEKRIKIIIIID